MTVMERVGVTREESVVKRSLGVCVFALVTIACEQQEGGDGGRVEPADMSGEVTPDAGDGSNAVPGVPIDGPTYHADIRPIIDRYCSRCHAEGGIGPLVFDYKEEDWSSGAPWWGPLVVDATKMGRMPPWQPADDCRQIVPDWSLPAAELARIIAWSELGYPLGEESDYVPPDTEPSLDVGAPDITAAAVSGYAPPTEELDDYHCLILDVEFDEDTFVRGINVEPDQRELVHHVLVFGVAPEFADELQALDDAEPGEGYTCFGGPGVASRELMKVWLPGGEPTMFPEGAALELEAGSKLVMQMHYNTLSVPDGQRAPLDRSRAVLWTLPPGEVPEEEVKIVGFADTSIVIPPGEANSVHERDFALGAEATIIGAIPHMHALGKSLRADVIRADGASECVIDIPAWDFDWQETYLFAEEQWIEIERGERHRVRCAYDNSPENQPVVGGVQASPVEVRWGEGTFDEMCLNYLIATVPYQDAGGDAVGCSEFEACARGCDAGDGRCYTRCTIVGGAACGGCTLQATAACGRARCQEQLEPVLACLDAYEDKVAALLDECSAQMDVLWECAKPQIEAGACNEEFSGCGVRF